MPAPAQCPRAAHREQTAFRISAFTFRLSMIAAALCAVNYVAYEAKWYAAIEALLAPVAVPLISGPARAIDGDTSGILLAMALLLGPRWSCLFCTGRIGRSKNRGKVTG